MAIDFSQIAIVNSEVRTPGISYEIMRAYIFFDTSFIPKNANIKSTYLSLYALAPIQMDSGDWNIVVQDGQPNYPHSILILADYNYNNYHNNGGQIAISTVNTGAYNNIPLNSNGINWINKGGITKFCLRNSFDISSKIPADGKKNGVGFESGTGNICKLVITYTI